MPLASWARPARYEPVSTSRANVDSASSAVATNVESPLSTNTLSSDGSGQAGCAASALVPALGSGAIVVGIAPPDAMSTAVSR